MRESDAIGHDADVVILLHKPEVENGGQVDLMEAHVAKNRNGRTGCATLNFRKAYTLFEDFEVAVPFSQSHAERNGAKYANPD